MYSIKNLQRKVWSKRGSVCVCPDPLDPPPPPSAPGNMKHYDGTKLMKTLDCVLRFINYCCILCATV